MNPELCLWRSVLLRILDDAAERYPDLHQGARTAIAREACAWVLGSSADFVEVCVLAGLDPCAVRDELRRRIADPDRARKLCSFMPGFGSSGWAKSNVGMLF